MKRINSNDDSVFLTDVETCKFPVSEFDHRAHLRIAYVYLVENTVEEAVSKIRETLTNLLIHARIEPAQKFHETLTEAWIIAVWHFMNKAQESGSADQFIDQNPEMLDSNIMMTHYSADLLFSEEARAKFVKPNLAPIPRH